MARVNCRNVEIKAKLINENDFIEKINIAKKLSGNDESKVLVQRDVFFKTSYGRLKIRYEQGTTAKLIRYERSDIRGPKLSEFDILEVEDGKLLEKILSNSIGKKSFNTIHNSFFNIYILSLGALGVLEKTRHLFMQDQTRIHLDIVKNGGTVFYGMEFEVKLEPEEDIEVGNKIAEDLMKKFKLNKDQLLEGSYFEILNP